MKRLWRYLTGRKEANPFRNFPPLDPKLLRLHVSAATYGEGGLR